jgi:hypothetical protein
MKAEAGGVYFSDIGGRHGEEESETPDYEAFERSG